jgi:hypothetical protein
MPEPDQRVRERQAGDYEPPILREPDGGPIPPWRPVDDEEAE